jgi:hypothetical protein
MSNEKAGVDKRKSFGEMMKFKKVPMISLESVNGDKKQLAHLPMLSPHLDSVGGNNYMLMN